MPHLQPGETQKDRCRMANVDQIGDASGGIIHYFPALQSERIAEANTPIDPTRSDIELTFDLKWIRHQAPAVRAALIAYVVYRGRNIEFNTGAYTLAGLASGTIVEEYFKGRESVKEKTNADKLLVDFFGIGNVVVPSLQELAWLQYALDFGATPGDLVEWGVSELTVIQLQWWKRREGESRLQQHIRAERNGWWLRALAKAVRDSYRNLLKFSDNGTSPEWFATEFRADLDEVLELMAFFDEDAERLPADKQAAWCEAFQSVPFSKLLPDATGRYQHFLPGAFSQGTLRQDVEIIARYLEKIGVQPSDWAAFDESLFGRVGNLTVA